MPDELCSQEIPPVNMQKFAQPRPPPARVPRARQQGHSAHNPSTSDIAILHNRDNLHDADLQCKLRGISCCSLPRPVSLQRARS